ncbi:fibronectin type III domain-containing protein [Cellulomonas sp. PhB150]|uniref:fibronectin type III domain-containing protein n=1 Tax=Cellulomonas sp. PhB150 TaxID=2485188 RepID=UPI0013155A94|nr:fibronectin type III domain-containing protein [Cellulomonas sp. PhB150]
MALAVLVACVVALAGLAAPAQAATPTKVTRVVATATGSTSLRVTWRAVSGATAYVVAVSTKPGMSSPKKLRGTGTSLKVTGLKKDVRYYVAVRAKAGSKVGARSAVATTRTWKTRPAAPTGVHLTGVGVAKFKVAWSKAKRATLYQVVVYSDKAKKHVVLRTALSSRTGRLVDSSTIKEGARYYYAVRAFNTRSTPGPFSKLYSVKTQAHQVKRATNIVVRPQTTSSLAVSWTKGALATGYTVSVSRTRDGAAFISKRTTGTSTTVTGVPRGVFFVSVTADRLRTTFAPARAVTAAPREPVPAGSHSSMKVGSYNVLRDSAERPFYKRVTAMAHLISDLDVVGVQEATYGKVSKYDGTSTQYRPVELLARSSGLRLGTGCSTHSEHVLYDDAKFDLVSCGEFTYTVGDDRYVAWDRLRDTTGRQVVVVSTHLTNGKTASDAAKRLKQGTQLAAWLKTLGSVPVVVAGDFNAWYGDGSSTPMEQVLKNVYYPSDLAAPSIVNGQYASFHAWLPTGVRATRIDHILTSSKVVPRSFAVRRTTEKTAPSDHHPIWAVVDVY